MVEWRLGNYELRRRLGEGGMAQVYLALDVRLGREVAVKVLDRTLADRPGFRERFMREARVAAALDHPNIVPLFDFGDTDGVGDKVRMQHQQGLAVRDDELLVADSYNDALKWVKIDTREARTWVRGFHEPGGVAIAERHAYVADTNAHRIMVVDYESGAMEPLEIVE